MTNLKKLVATVTLMGIIIIGVTNANAGILMSDATDRDTRTCTEVKVDNGIIFELTGIIFELVGLDKQESDTNVDCGLILE